MLFLLAKNSALKKIISGMMNDEKVRIDGEWVTVNAIREALKIANRGDISKSTYDDALEIGGEIYPELLGENVSLLRRERLSNITKEFVQKAKAKSFREKQRIEALDLVNEEIEDISSLIDATTNTNNKEVDRLVKRKEILKIARSELTPMLYKEGQLITRDAYRADRFMPVVFEGKDAKAYSLPNHNGLNIRVLHPDKPEHITGADLIYEYHNTESDKVSLVLIQYKIWEGKKCTYQMIGCRINLKDWRNIRA